MRIVQQCVSTRYSTTTIQLKSVFGLNGVLWHDVLTDQVCVIFEPIGGVQQLFCWFYREMKCVFLLSNWGKGRQKPKASCNSVLAKGKVKYNIDDWVTICQTIGFVLDI